MPKRINIEKFAFLLPLILFILNFCTKLIYLTFQDIGLDEPFSIYHAQFPVSIIIEQLKAYNNPPLFELLLHFWIKVFGISPFSVRLLPMLFACLGPVALYYFAKNYFSLRIAITSSLLLTFSNLLMFYSHDCRVYSLFVLLSISSMHFYLNTLLDNQVNLKNRILFVVMSTLLIYAHYFGAFILFFQGMHLLIFYRLRIKQFLIYYVLIFLLYMPHLFPLLVRFRDSVDHGTWLKPPEGLESLYNMIWTFSNYPFIAVGCLTILVVALGKFVVYRKTSTNFYLIFLILLWFLVPFFGMFFISFWVPMYLDRYLIFALPAYYITLALCIDYLSKETTYKNLFSAILLSCFLMTLKYNPDKKQPVTKALTLIKENKKENTIVMVNPFYFLPVFAYHYNKQAFSAISDNKEYHLTDSLLRVDHIYHIQQLSDVFLLPKNDYSQVLYFTLEKEKNTLEDPVYQRLDSTFKLQWKKQVGANWFISSFTKPPKYKQP